MSYTFDEKKHAHMWCNKPLIGTTSLINEMMPPPLHWWSSGKALEKLGWLNTKYSTVDERYRAAGEGARKVSNMTQTEYADFLQECYKNHDEFKKEAGDWGQSKHHAIEVAVKEAIQTNSGLLKEEPYSDEAVERFATWGRGKTFIHSEVCVYSELLFIGGIIDLVYMDDGQYYLGDVKTAKSGLKPSQFIQMGLYDLQQGENGYYTEAGEKVGDAQDIAGYTVVPIPMDTTSKFESKTYRNTKALKAFGLTLVEAYRTKKELEIICK